MNLDSVTTMPRGHRTALKTVLNQDGVTCSLATLAPGDELSSPPASTGQGHLLFVIEGSLAVQLDDLSYLLNQDQALHVAKDKSESVRNQSGAWAKLLRIDLPNREIVRAPIFTVPDEATIEQPAGVR